MSSSLTLFTKFAFAGDLVAKNRIILAPLTRGRCGRSQVPTDISAEYYVQRASAGFLITEGNIISRAGMGWAGAGAIYSPEHVEGWKKVPMQLLMTIVFANCNRIIALMFSNKHHRSLQECMKQTA